ncbi:MAG: hypothetical protein ACE5HS_02320 [bacterium]
MKINLWFWLCAVATLLTCKSNTDIAWQPVARFENPEIKESSGLVKSRQFKNVFWTHNDSGNDSRIFATTQTGEFIGNIRIEDAENIDWEDIAVDDSGHLIIGDFGNNANDRQDLAIYVIEEPDPSKAKVARVSKRIPFSYPDQKQFPNPQNMNFDCEAAFWANGHLYLLTKHRSNHRTKLYRFNQLVDNQKQILSKIGEFEIDGMVTAADVSPNGSRLAILCYEYIYLFEKPKDSDNYLAGPHKKILLEGRQSEGICFDGSDIVFTNEQAEIYRLPESYFDNHRAFLPPLPTVSVKKINETQLQKLTLNALPNQLSLKKPGFAAVKRSDCDMPLVKIGWFTDGFILTVPNNPTSTNAKKKHIVANIMFGMKNQRSVTSQPGAFIWDIVAADGQLQLQQIYPQDKKGSQKVQAQLLKSNDARVLFLKITTGALEFLEMKNGTRCLFNIILNPGKKCEWYWASDSSMFAKANPYIWGELVLQE